MSNDIKFTVYLKLLTTAYALFLVVSLVNCIFDKRDISSSVVYLSSFLGDKHFKNISS
jgi:hypothetical protein